MRRAKARAEPEHIRTSVAAAPCSCPPHSGTIFDSAKDLIREGTAIAERRQLTRVHLAHYLRVFDEEKGEVFGQVVDITTEGMRVVSEKPIAVGECFRLALDVPRRDQEPTRVSLQARCIWSLPDTDPRFHKAGFQLDDAPPAMTAIVRALIAMFEPDQ